MRPLAIAFVCTVVAIAATACGTSGASSGDGPGSVGGGVDPLVGPGGARSCSDDADCHAGESCRLVRVGEMQQHVCVPEVAVDDAGQAPILGARDAGDASFASDAAKKTDAGPKPTSDSGVACSKTLNVTLTVRGPNAKTCIFNSTVEADSPAWLTYACAGGAASVTFGDQTFAGKVTGTMVDVRNVDDYLVPVPGTGTSCGYTSTQTIKGDLSSGTVSYDYTEVLADGQPLICQFLLVPCYQSGPVTVQ